MESRLFDIGLIAVAGITVFFGDPYIALSLASLEGLEIVRKLKIARDNRAFNPILNNVFNELKELARVGLKNRQD